MKYLLSAILLHAACRVIPADTDTHAPTSTGGVDTPVDTSETDYTWDGDVVVFISIDTVSHDFLGPFHSNWDTTPNLDALFAESTLFSNTVIVRGFTKPSITSLHTGLYPRNTGIRDNNQYWTNQVPGLFQIFQEAGYRTYGFFTNMCELVDYNVDERSCTSVEELPEFTTQSDSDQLEVDALLEALAVRPEGTPLFIRLHLMDPHDPYNAVPEYYDEFHPVEYTGSYNPSSPDIISAETLNAVRLSQDDINHLHAVYASQLKSTDAMIGEFLAGLKELGLYEDALIVFGSDHGDELATRSNYTYHGCSFYNSVLLSAYSIRAPGLPAGQSLEGWISTTDVAPTILDIAGLTSPSEQDGRSLLSEIINGRSPNEPVFFERGVFTAGVIDGRYKYVLNPEGAYEQCAPYNTSTNFSYPNAVVEIYDLESDPEEQVNLMNSPPAEADALKTSLCTWVTESTWQTEKTDLRNRMLIDCHEFLGSSPPKSR